jgi:hypothetical protein
MQMKVVLLGGQNWVLKNKFFFSITCFRNTIVIKIRVSVVILYVCLFYGV